LTAGRYSASHLDMSATYKFFIDGFPNRALCKFPQAVTAKAEISRQPCLLGLSCLAIPGLSVQRCVRGNRVPSSHFVPSAHYPMESDRSDMTDSSPSTEHQNYRLLGVGAHTCNPSYSGGRNKEDYSSKPAWANSL
jgi:hypothetical protein